MPRETDLYAPIKAFLESQGYGVKAEIGGVDVMARRDGEPPVLVELKLGFSLTLFHQATARQAVSDRVYVAVARGSGRRWRKALADNLALARRLGLGVLSVRLADGFVEPHLDPQPYHPRLSARRSERLLREFARRVGDPNQGGAARARIVTAYRQDALRIALYLKQAGPSRGRDVASGAGVARATQMMAADHYGWFERVERGVYALTPAGQAGLAAAGDHMAALETAPDQPTGP